jgi:hypothetical protein
VHLDALGKELTVSHQFLSVDIDELLPGAPDDGRVEAENWVVIDGGLNLQKLLVFLLAAVDDVAQ